MGFVLSYRAGAWNMISAVPMRQANVNIHRNSLSRTMATYCQSSMICIGAKVCIVRIFCYKKDL